MLILFICAIVGFLLAFIGYKIDQGLVSGTFKSNIASIFLGIGAIIFTFSIGMIILTPLFNTIIDEQELENLTETIIEKNYKDCAFIEDNQFYSNGKLYQYRWDKNKSKVIIIRKGDNEKEVDCFKLDE